jgi:hypothetical protein
VDLAWIVPAAAAIAAIAGSANSVWLIVRESGKLRQIERLTDVIMKIDADSASFIGLRDERDRLVSNYLAQTTSSRKASLRLALWSGVFYLIGIACFGIGLASMSSAYWQAWTWGGAGLVLVGAFLISRADRRLSIEKRNAAASS